MPPMPEQSPPLTRRQWPTPRATLAWRSTRQRVEVPPHQQIHVNVCPQSRGFFAPAVGATPSDVCRAATAMLDETIVIVAAVLALDPSGPEAFHLEGAAQVVGVWGSLVANSSSSTSFHMKDATSATTTGPSACICAVGTSSINGSATAFPLQPAIRAS